MFQPLRKVAAFALAVAAATLPPSAQAQSDGIGAGQPVCWLGDMRFSPGAIVRFANAYKLCGTDSAWETTTETPAGCFHGGQFYSVGAKRNAIDSATTLLIVGCAVEGNWVPLN